ncbi:MAG: MBL fold metallo-hydrolase, partial [Gemmatimonadetes bacterium]|nr:MBL fold metallo-hydrolase [Gemmatimonadota bacterium]NIU75699.1 MBL fold metallo-hydrolase [Gammaproteobacteria bacterium]NIQ55489.1 MBL fold metallo-hydrolase [Gemmatimonadota bacterium]NIW37796.1 MBL fold metallo-hydrolase [Gemmatimonadota bacterium]NIX46134.1 MBL fold metallo-hydrolase [Gemmatimonadota bacterium]
MAPERLDDVRATGAVVVDTRSADAFAAGHVPGTINIPLTRAFTTWAGWLVPYDADFYLIGDEAGTAEAVRDLAMIGLDRVAGAFGLAAVEDRAPEELERI